MRNTRNSREEVKNNNYKNLVFEAFFGNFAFTITLKKYQNSHKNKLDKIKKNENLIK